MESGALQHWFSRVTNLVLVIFRFLARTRVKATAPGVELKAKALRSESYGD